MKSSKTNIIVIKKQTKVKNDYTKIEHNPHWKGNTEKQISNLRINDDNGWSR